MVRLLLQLGPVLLLIVVMLLLQLEISVLSGEISLVLLEGLLL